MCLFDGVFVCRGCCCVSFLGVDGVVMVVMVVFVGGFLVVRCVIGVIVVLSVVVLVRVLVLVSLKCL